ncbi:MAG: DUF5777 family beta-barrel protein [Bacteroidia bacterium]
MKTSMNQKIKNNFLCGAVCLSLFAFGNKGFAQDSTKKVIERVPQVFPSNYLIDNQTADVNPLHTLELSIQHRFGTTNNGYQDMFGIFAPATIRLGVAFVPINNLQVGIGVCKDKMQWDGNIKYNITKQAVSGGCPVSVTYFGDIATTTIPFKGNYVKQSDRLSYFNQLMIARKVTDRFSVQVSGSYSYFNNVPAYLDNEGQQHPTMKNGQFTFSAMGQYMLTDHFGFVANYDQPLTQNVATNPHPNLAGGIQVTTASHDFQIFCGNYQQILQQSNSMYNQNDYKKGNFCIGFNIVKRFYL